MANDQTQPTPPIIKARGLTKIFDEMTAVEDLSLDVPAGSIFGFVGPSGCGKTTTVRLMLGVYAPDEGEIEVFGTSPSKFSRSERAQIGYMPQQFVLYPELTVWENMNFAASLYAYPLRRKKRLQELLELVELTGHEKKSVRKLSGGMQRRLSLAVSILHNPKLIFLDEPTAGIDPVLRRKFWDYFQYLKKEENDTLFVTTQYVGEAAYCDYVGVMADGRLLMVDTPEELRHHAMGGEVIHLHPANFLSKTQFELLREQTFVSNGRVTRLRDGGLEIVVKDAGKALPQMMEWCTSQEIAVEAASEHVPPFDDVFVELINQNTKMKETADVH